MFEHSKQSSTSHSSTSNPQVRPDTSSSSSSQRPTGGRGHEPPKSEKEVWRRVKEMVGDALDVLQMALNIAAGTAGDAGVPGLSSGLSALVEVLRKIQAMKSNIDGVDTLYSRIVALKDALQKFCSRPRGQRNEDMQQRIDQLSETWRGIADRAQHIKNRGAIKRFFTSNADALKLEGLVQEINTSIQDFLLQGVLSIDDTVHIVHQEVQAIRTQLEMSFLSTYAKRAQYDSNIVRRGCLKGTRREVLTDADGWIRTSLLKAAATTAQRKSGHVLWINGLAGTGKTTVAFSITEKCGDEGILGANFFCSRSDAECSDVNSIFLTISRQLCQYHEPFKEKVTDALRKNPDIATAGPLRQFEKLILHPLRELEGLFPACVIIIDALDECHDESTKSIILDILARYMQELAPFLFIITSRPERHIAAVFEKAHGNSLKDATTSLTLHVHVESVLDDIRHYLAEGFRDICAVLDVEDGWPSAQDINRLAELSQGLFIFATTALRFIGDKHFGNPKNQLRVLLTASVSIMRDLYLEVLKTAFNNISTLNSTNPTLRRVLGTLTLAEEPLSTQAIAGLLGLTEKDIRNTLAGLRSVLHVPESSDEIICFIHPTFPEFLLDSSASGPPKPEAFRVVPSEHHLAMLYGSLVAMDSLKRNITGIESPTAFKGEIPGLFERVRDRIPVHVGYACRHWSAHLVHYKSGEPAQACYPLLRRFLTSRMLCWLEACSLLRSLDSALEALETAQRACQTLHLKKPGGITPIPALTSATRLAPR